MRVMQPVHVRRDWFEDAAGVVHFMIRYGARPLPLDKSGSTSVEVGGLDALPGVIDTVLAAVRAGELDVQLAAAAQERSKAFKRRSGAPRPPNGPKFNNNWRPASNGRPCRRIRGELHVRVRGSRATAKRADAAGDDPGRRYWSPIDVGGAIWPWLRADTRPAAEMVARHSQTSPG